MQETQQLIEWLYVIIVEKSPWLGIWRFLTTFRWPLVLYKLFYIEDENNNILMSVLMCQIRRSLKVLSKLLNHLNLLW